MLPRTPRVKRKKTQKTRMGMDKCLVMKVSTCRFNEINPQGLNHKLGSIERSPKHDVL